jgi:Tfp pilus assembly protein PilN
MRPVNLIPPEQRQGAHAPMRTGPIPYILVGALAAVLAAIALLVLTSNQISERESEIAELGRKDAAAQQQAKRLAGYVQLQTLHEQRLATISNLANSRFDWERVMRELSLILPHDVWLTNLDASASGAQTGGAAAASALRGAVPGPALELTGCATGQESVAGFVTALKDIDGVTRVAVQSSELPKQEDGAGQSGGSGGGGSEGGECQTREFIAKFEVVVAFDAAPLPIESLSEEGAVPVPAPAPAPAESAGTTTASTESSGSSESTGSESGSSGGG